MFERFTERARRVIILAQEEAKRLNHSTVGIEHILLGIIREGEGVASKVLESLSISPDRVRTEIESAIGRGEQAPYEEVAFTQRAKKVLELALDEARRLSHNYIGTEHLLLGVIREGEGVPAHVLEAMGADLERVRAQVVYLLGEEGRTVYQEARKFYEQLRRTTKKTNRAWAEIDLDALASNVQALSASMKPAAFMAVVKADAYGHGQVAVSRAVLDAGATWLGVATIEEGLALRKGGVQAPTLILGPLYPGDASEALRHGLDITLGSIGSLDDWGPAVASVPTARVHLKVDTGMNRFGILPEEVPLVLERLHQLGISLYGCYTHLACADDPDPAFTREQLARFSRVLAEVRKEHPHVLAHAANSAAAIAYPESRFDMVRVGLAIYGLSPASHLGARIPLRPAMTLKSRVVRVSRLEAGGTVSYGAAYRASASTTIATIACGYGDGYPRLTNERSAVIIRGRRAPIVGRVTMDYMMVDVGTSPVMTGDEAVLFGQEPTAEEVASSAQTISYDILCRVGPRVPRVYLHEGREVSPASEWG
jgi:alanine racemase